MMDKILCPYCPEGIPMRMAKSGTHMRCLRCQATSPVINQLHTAAVEPEKVVRAAARRRYVPGMLQPKWRTCYEPVDTEK